jgi:leucyl aminopeptidase
MFDFSGKKGQCQAVRTGTGNAKFVALCGLGPRDKATPTSEWGPSTFQSFGSCIASSAKSNKAKSVAVTILGGLCSDDTKAAAAGKVANGFINGGYEATRFKSKPAPEGVASLELLFADGSSSAAATEAITRGDALARGAMFTRYLVESPPNVATPTYLAEAAASIAKSAPGVMKLKVLEKKDCERLGMGCYLGVAEASGEPPKFIHLTYTPPDGKVNKTLAIVGKGLTFDSGGYNIKAGAGSLIEMMKFDMGGSAAALGAAKALSMLRPKGVAVHFIVASCENMIAGSGLRPGDILVASNGKTVEVNNTDAEGRLTLADALLYAQDECKAESIIDIATLTGACIVALGNGVCGVWSPDDSMAASISTASKTAGEKVWRMPLEESYADDLKSPIADMKNSGGRWGGAITAALFLKEFVKTDNVTWAHMDIAGPVWNDKLGGATGFGAQTLAEWAAGHE